MSSRLVHSGPVASLKLVVHAWPLVRFHCVDEAFIDMPQSVLHAQSFTNEVTWVSNWFQRLVKKYRELQERGVNPDTAVFFADRSPFSAVLYSKSCGSLLIPVIRGMIDDLREIGIVITTVQVNVERELLWTRIQDRLAREPIRRAFDEHQRDWMDKVCDFYDQQHWDLRVDNSGCSLQQLADGLIQKLFTNHDLADTSPASFFKALTKTTVASATRQQAGTLVCA